MVLLALFLDWQPMLNLQFGIVHVNHMLRGAESDEDEAFVAEAARSLGLPFFVCRKDVAAIAKENGMSLEEAGRDVRNSFFEACMRDNDADSVATAHHLDDHAETVLMHLLSGTGLDGLAGIRLRRDRFIRPLLFATRKQLEAYANKNAIDWREDSSNDDLRFLRNRIRHLIIPFMEENAGRFRKETLLRSGLALQEWLSEADKGLTETLQKLEFDEFENKIRLEIPRYRRYFSRNRLKLLEHCIFLISGQAEKLSFNQFQDFSNWLDKQHGRRFRLSKHVFAQVHSGVLYIAGQQLRHKLYEEILPDRRYEFKPPGIAITAFADHAAHGSRTDEASIEKLDAAKIQFPLILRIWKTADRFQPLGMKQDKRVKDFLKDEKQLLLPKDSSLVLQSGNDIIAVLGQRISEKYKITQNTSQIIHVKTERV